GIFLAESDTVRCVPGIDDVEVGGLAVLDGLPGEGPDLALYLEWTGVHFLGSDRYRVTGITASGVVGVDQERLGLAVHELVAGVEAGAAPAVVAQLVSRIPFLAIGRVEIVDLGLPASGVGAQGIETGGGGG